MKFEKVKLKCFKVILENGVKKKIQKTFFQTINPFNKISDKNNSRYGLIKNRNDILIELKKDVENWKLDIN